MLGLLTFLLVAPTSFASTTPLLANVTEVDLLPGTEVIESPKEAAPETPKAVTVVEAAPTPDGILVPEVGLSAAVKKNLSGLQFEKINLSRLQQQARDYIDYKRGRMNVKRRMLWVADCLANRSEDNIYCRTVSEQKGPRKNAERGEKSGRRELTGAFQVAQALTEADISALKGASTSQLHRALKLFPNWEPLSKTADAALKSSSCHVSLLTSLAQKTEEFFPDPKYRSLALALYQKASECKPEDDVVNRARYRLSLLYVWDNRCQDAEPILQKLSEDKTGENASRSLFWRSYCARATGNKLLYTALRGRLVKEYPLSYHGLMLSRAGKQALRMVGMMNSAEPALTFRSQLKPELNPYVRAVEMLQKLGAADLGYDLLKHLEEIDQTEPDFRLYVAVLMNRSNVMIGQFKILSSIFRDDPSIISRASLELFYPLRRFEVLKRYGNHVDPFLVAALIRQESGFNERARSPVGALGLMQLMPGTARRMERVSKRELMDAKTNIRLGVKYFYKLLDRFNLDAELALAAYNAGPERVEDWKKRYTTLNRMLFLDLIPFKETRDYVALIARNYYWYLNLYQESSSMDISGRVARSPSSSAAKKPVVFTLFSCEADDSKPGRGC